MTVLVDSDILIEVLRARDAEISRRWTVLSESEDIALCSPVTVAEVWSGARPREHAIIANIFRTLVCVQIGQETGRLAGDYLREFRKSHALYIADALIAACAMQHDAKLWTRNRKHYPMRDLSFF